MTTPTTADSARKMLASPYTAMPYRELAEAYLALLAEREGFAVVREPTEAQAASIRAALATAPAGKPFAATDAEIQSALDLFHADNRKIADAAKAAPPLSPGEAAALSVPEPTAAVALFRYACDQCLANEAEFGLCRGLSRLQHDGELPAALAGILPDLPVAYTMASGRCARCWKSGGESKLRAYRPTCGHPEFRTCPDCYAPCPQCGEDANPVPESA